MNDSTFEPAPKGVVRVFACGGCPINIMAKLRDVSINADLLADIQPVLIDASRSNLTVHSRNAEAYLLEGLDGSGKIRSENHGVISQRVKDILQKHKPGDLNIVFSSGGGGSGSVLAPLITSELLERNLPVVVLMVGSVASVKETENTIKTMKSYEAIAQARQAPVVMSYLQNSTTLPRGAVDRQMISTITFLAMLYSRRNRELDTKDLYHWLRYTKPVTSYGPQLTSLNVLWHDQGSSELAADLGKLGNVISVATLAQEGIPTDLPVMPEYQTVGIIDSLPKTEGGQNLERAVINYVISDGLVSGFFKDLDKVHKEQAALASSRPPASTILSHGDSVDETGLIL